MPTPIFACDAECGQGGAIGQHFALSGTASFSTSVTRTGARSFRVNPTAGVGAWTSIALSAGATWVYSTAIRFDVLPTTDAMIISTAHGVTVAGAAFKVSDSKLYAGADLLGTGITFGATGVAVIIGVWYIIDIQTVGSTISGTVDVRVASVACGQVTGVFAANNATQVKLGVVVATTTDVFFESANVSQTAADYPLGAGYIIPCVPVGDGPHNVAGTNDFERSAGGVDILNTTEDAFDLCNDVPLKAATTPIEFINMVLPVNATDYVGLRMGPAPGMPAITKPPQFVECIILIAQASTATGNMEVRLHDSSNNYGTGQTIYTATTVAGVVEGAYKRAGFALNASGTAWTVEQARDLRVRFGSPAAVDAAPDQYLASVMIEMAFAGDLPPTFDADYSKHPRDKIAQRAGRGRSLGSYA